MPPKKAFMTPKSGKKAAQQACAPESENDFLDLADEHEQSAGKWRAGDAVKATRFFKRAIDAYSAGLQRYPRSFDLAYNKANLEYNLSADLRILPHLGSSKIALLEETLRSHQAAMALDPGNTDALFNTGQVLTSLAEAMLESKTESSVKRTAGMLLENAVDIFTKCLDSQQKEYEDMQRELGKAGSGVEGEDGGIELGPKSSETNAQESMETSSTPSEGPGEWATVVEAITPETLLDTCTAQLGALTTLLSLYDPSDLAAIEAKAQNGLLTADTKIPTLISLIRDTSPSIVPEEPTSGPTLSIGSSSPAEELTSSPKDEALLATANFHASIASITYLSARTTSPEYLSRLEQIFAPLAQTSTPPSPTLDVANINALSAYADALLELSSAIAERSTLQSSTYENANADADADAETQWTSLTRAQTILTTLSTGSYTTTLPASRLAATFLSRGDIDLFRFRLSLSPTAAPAWVKSRPALVSNAGVFYRGARSYAERAGDGEARRMADAKAIVAEVMREVGLGSGVVKEGWKGRGADVQRVLEGMVEEGIVGRGDMEGVVRFTE
ncbi:hypothetical protein P154DRAFT_492381 [Amniculicola lignicola CBS 123094]|uniref:TPR-like protein n=1 Tax=Amniculicola lignicola CBS 123094 TaxID=1392246 RepID=A0A6A5WEG7_9PLEO|nr:hypothetical protein P154DRAFT_492381 [Amniculicola lignicola CBS 123094]